MPENDQTEPQRHTGAGRGFPVDESKSSAFPLDDQMPGSFERDKDGRLFYFPTRAARRRIARPIPAWFEPQRSPRRNSVVDDQPRTSMQARKDRRAAQAGAA